MAEMIEIDRTGIAAETKSRVDSSEDTSSSEKASEKCTVSSKPKEYTWLLLGVTGAGKSCLGNFLLGEESTFSESEESEIMASMTETASCEPGSFCDSDGLEHKIHVIDTPGLGDTRHLGKHDSKAKDIAEDAACLATELTKMMMLIRGGITAFLLVIPINVREHSGTLNLLECLDIFGNYWNHTILVLTHGMYLGMSEEDQNKKLQSVLKGPRCPVAVKKVLMKVKNRHVIVEAKEWRGDSKYRNSVLRKLMLYSDDMTTQHGPYHDDLNSIGNKAVEKAELELCEQYEDLRTPEAQEAIFDAANEHMEEVILKLVRIKLADGVDVDKLQKMNKVKQSELENLHKQTEYLKKRHEEDKEKLRKAEERRYEEEMEKVKAQVALQMEEERRIEAEKRNIEAEEKRVLTEKLINKAEEARQQAEQVKVEERRRREQAEQEKKEERRRREQAEQEKKEERRRREQAEQEIKKERRRREQAEQEKEEEMRRRERAEREKEEERRRREQAEKEKEEEKCRRIQAEQVQERRRQQVEEVQEGERRRECERDRIRQVESAWRNRDFFKRIFHIDPSSN